VGYKLTSIQENLKYSRGH